MKISRFFVEQNEMEKLKFSFLKRVVAVILGPIRFWFVHVLRILNLVSKTNIESIWSECVFEAYSIIYKPSASRIWGNRSVQKLYTKLPWLGSKEIRRHHFEELIFRSLEWKGWYSGRSLRLQHRFQINLLNQACQRTSWVMARASQAGNPARILLGKKEIARAVCYEWTTR